MGDDEFLRLSPHVLPQVRQRLHLMTPQNLCPGADRLRYAEGILTAQRTLVGMGQVDLARAYRENVLHSYVTTWREGEDGDVEVAPLLDVECALSLQLDQVGVLLRDGRIRDDSAMVYLPTGADTAELAALLRLLHRGVRRSELMARAAELDLGFDDELLDGLVAQGVVEPGQAPAPPAEQASTLTWLGHAYVRAAAGGKSVWFDPFPAPRMRWTEAERTSMFSADVPDSFLLDDYGPDAHHVTQDELPVPDAVFVTHQDLDHCDLGALALLPPSVPIYVPFADPAHPWEVDLVVAIRTILGTDREVRVMRHGDVVEVGPLRVTAMPFLGEFPTCLPHHWNTFLVELPDQVWGLFADGALTDLHVDLMRDSLRGDPRPLGIMTNQIAMQRSRNGYFDKPSEPYTVARLWSWYVPPASLFAPALTSGPTPAELARLVAEAGLAFVYPYAHGNLPWYRVSGSYVLNAHVASHSLAHFDHMEHVTADAGATLVRLRHGQPFRPDQARVRYQAAGHVHGPGCGHAH